MKMENVWILLLLHVGIKASVSVPVVNDRTAFETISSMLEEETSSDQDYILHTNDDSLPKLKDSFNFPSNERMLDEKRNHIPSPKHRGHFRKDYNATKISKLINSWTPEDGTNIWELSGLFEGDIMFDTDNEKHVLLNVSQRWNHGIIPYKITDDFDTEQRKVIKNALDELSDKTCLIFRPYKEDDADYIVVEGKQSGCWSYVGRQGEGQILNLQTPACVKHGVVIHEFMHAVGFYHQQSSADRDEYVTIHWENIKEKHKHNFKKYDNETVTNYDVGYDYGSLMHYGPRAFSKNMKNTITPKVANVTIGQRDGLSEKDASKAKILYANACSDRDSSENIITRKSFENGTVTSLKRKLLLKK